MSAGRVWAGPVGADPPTTLDVGREFVDVGYTGDPGPRFPAETPADELPPGGFYRRRAVIRVTRASLLTHVAIRILCGLPLRSRHLRDRAARIQDAHRLYRPRQHSRHRRRRRRRR